VRWVDLSEVQELRISWQVATESQAYLSDCYVRSLILKMQQCPQFKAGVGDSQANTVAGCKSYGVIQSFMLIDIEHTPCLTE